MVPDTGIGGPEAKETKDWRKDKFALFFKGWWTLIIIIPCVVSIIRRGAGSGRIIGLVIGVILLLGSWDLQPVSVEV